jgi:hypothetical protein
VVFRACNHIFQSKDIHVRQSLPPLISRRATDLIWNSTPLPSPEPSPTHSYNPDDLDPDAWLLGGDDWFAPSDDLPAPIGYDGNPVPNLDRAEVDDLEELDCLLEREEAEEMEAHLQEPEGGPTMSVEDKEAMEAEARGLALQHPKLRVFRLTNPKCIVTTNMPFWPENLGRPPSNTTRPPISLTNIFIIHFLDECRPHLAFIPVACTFRGALLSEVYWNDDPAEMVEKLRGESKYRARNSEELRDAFHCLDAAATALMRHVYPPSLRFKLDYLGNDTLGMGRWHHRVKHAMYFGRRDLTRVLEMLGLVTMLVAMSRLLTGEKDTWQRVIANERWFRRRPSDIHSLEHSVITKWTVPRVGAWIDVENASPLLRFHVQALEVVGCPIFVRWFTRPLSSVSTFLHDKSILMRYVASYKQCYHAPVPSFDPPRKGMPTPFTFDEARPDKPDDVSVQDYFAFRQQKAQYIRANASERQLKPYLDNLDAVELASGFLAGVTAYEWSVHVGGATCTKVLPREIPATRQRYAKHMCWYDFISHCLEIGPIFAPLVPSRVDKNEYDVIGPADWWLNQYPNIIGHPRMVIHCDIANEHLPEVTAEQEAAWQDDLREYEPSDVNVLPRTHYATLVADAPLLKDVALRVLPFLHEMLGFQRKLFIQ